MGDGSASQFPATPRGNVGRIPSSQPSWAPGSEPRMRTCSLSLSQRLTCVTCPWTCASRTLRSPCTQSCLLGPQEGTEKSLFLQGQVPEPPLRIQTHVFQLFCLPANLRTVIFVTSNIIPLSIYILGGKFRRESYISVFLTRICRDPVRVWVGRSSGSQVHTVLSKPIT